MKAVDFEMFRETLETWLYKNRMTNRRNSKTRAMVEHVFGYFEQSLCGMYSRVVGFARNAARNTLTKLVHNVCRYEQVERLGMNQQFNILICNILRTHPIIHETNETLTENHYICCADFFGFWLMDFTRSRGLV